MDIRPEKVVPPYNSDSNGSFFIVLLSVALFFGFVGGIVYFSPLRDKVSGLIKQDLSPPMSLDVGGHQPASGNRPVPNFSGLYRSWGIDPIDPADLDQVITDNMLALQKAPCDWPLVEKVAMSLLKKRKQRDAANIYLGYSQSCPSDGEAERNAANLFSGIKDYEKARALFTSLTVRFSGNDLDWYHKGQAEHGLGMRQEAIQSFATMISLVHDQARLGEWVFTELSALYAESGRYCEAMTPLSTFMSLDPVKNDTARTHAMLQNLSQQGHCTSYAVGRDSFPVTGSGVIHVRAKINGVWGQFVVDTGASFVALNPDFAERAGVKGDEDVAFTTANGETSGKVAKADTIQLGKVQANDVPVIIMASRIRKLDGLLGRSFLARFEMTVTASSLTLATKSLER